MLTLKQLSWSVWTTNIINNLNLELQEGTALGLVGPNGCGKTSLLNLINGFHFPNEGQIIFQEKDISRIKVEERAKLGIGRVFQSFWIFKNLTLFENLALAYAGQLSRKQYFLPLTSLPAHQKEEIQEILQELGLLEKQHQLAGNLSGGQMRLLEIARLYLQQTTLYLLDEPTAGVAPKLKETVASLIRKIIQKGKTVIIVEHDFEFLSQFVDTLAMMNEGKVVLTGDYATIKNHPMTREIYFWA